MSRRRYTDDEKTKFLTEFDQHGGSAAAFCREQGLTYQTFLGWRRGWDGESQPDRPMETAEFVEVELQPGNQAPGRSMVDPAVELVLGGGTVLRIYPNQSHRS